MQRRAFSLGRFWAIVAKEFIQMRRDRITLGMMLGIPLTQLILFGYAINSDPRHLPTAILCGDNSVFSRSIVASMQTSSYFHVVRQAESRADAQEMLRSGTVQFILTIPELFGRRIVRGRTPGPAAGSRRHGSVRFQQRRGRFSRNRTKRPANRI